MHLIMIGIRDASATDYDKGCIGDDRGKECIGYGFCQISDEVQYLWRG